MIVSLTGFMGCGKSSVGRGLSELLGWHLVDLDRMIEDEQGRAIPEIFEVEGEGAFRSMELEALKKIVESSENIVLSLGGGTVMTAECAALVREKTYCIYLKASVDTILSHLKNNAEGRPMLQGENIRERISSLMAVRESTYSSSAHKIILTDGRSQNQICSVIQTAVRARL